MDDEVVDEENDGEDDTLLELSGSRKRFPLPGAPKMSWENTATYGAIGPLWFGRGKGALHKERRARSSTTMITRAVFTQVRAALRRKTLLLLWWIDERTMVETQRSSPARSPRGESSYARMSVQGPKSFLRLLWPSFYRSRGHHNGKSVIAY
jgi:hypothetical protein